jgi:hypothetical protein
MVRFIKSLLSAGLLVGLGLAVGCSGADTGTSGQTKKDVAAGMNKMKQKQDEIAKKHDQPGGAAADDADKDKADEKKDEKPKTEPPKKDKQ